MSRARAALRSNQPQNAVAVLLNAAGQTHLQARDYDEMLRLLAEALQQVGQLRAAATVWMYLRDARRVQQLSGNEPRDLGRAAQLEGQHAAAAQQYREARWPAHAAIAYERARRFAEARVLWEEVAADPALRDDPTPPPS
jgi:tetratricopeptide (TPR) repeat protein